eukprot:jgi/Ulvmu1/42/UM001_0045.1
MQLIYAASLATVLIGSAVVTGQELNCQGACVATWKKCSGEGIPAGTIRPCCKPDDHCVEKTSSYGQCRPVDRDIPSSWPSGEVLTCTVCDPATREVRRVNPLRRDDGNFHWMAADEDIREFFIDTDENTPPSYALTAAINACRLHENVYGLGPCIGFAMEETGRFGVRVTLLYDIIDFSTHTHYRGDLAEDPAVYDIQACL